MLLDIERASQQIHSKSLKRKWKALPRIARLYISIGIAFTICLFVIFILSKLNSESVVPQNSDTYEKVDQLVTNGKEFHKLDPNRDQLSDQLVKPISNKNEDNIHINEDNIHINDANIEPKSADEVLPNIESLSLQIFQKSIQRHQNEEQKAIVKALKHSWSAYRAHAWGSDHLKPITKSKHNWFGVGLTILDSLDTLIMMGLEEEFNEALNWIKNDLRFDVYKDVNCFEMTIRTLGGLLSAYHLTNEATLLLKASDVGERLIHCFDTPNKLVPFSDVNLKTKNPKTPNWSPDSSLSEATSVQLEFRDLSYLTGIPKYEKLSFHTSLHIHNLTVKSGESLLPMFINPYTGQFSRGTITLGARGDSYYEYLLKQYLQTGIQWLKDDYIKAINEVKKRLMRTTSGPLKLLFIGEILRSSSFNDIHPKMDHLVCFLSGTLALGYYHEVIKSPKIRGHSVTDDSEFGEHLSIAEQLARTCNMMYNLTKTGLSPEIAYFDMSGNADELQIRPADAHNLLRPEFVESLFFLYHITGHQKYREWGWNVFQAFEKYTKVPSGGYTSIDDVRNPSNVRPKDMMESFWIAETLKYLYLLFCDDKQIINKLLDSYVFNTEGHILPRRV